MRESLSKREQLPLARAEIALGKDRDDTSAGEAALDACLDQIARALRPVIDIVTDRDTTDA